jgi:hypothetical protein
MLSLSALATKEGVGARVDLAARVNKMLSVGAYGLAAYDWRSRSVDAQAGFKASLRW